ncbi:hypothetical protein CONLIGDRAFT_396513 [Coniochaeta ligniaria NRRL 30616]|uniref:Uncharacterized protein n=1 Tax=Coniochaeta ligniaria NRRL 30616 TaxID=1408157 RepID=A0A1J7INC7_9PEZI|nr:hypothetical protein CONLIGDRAFT_396513 [Coniochaeta ligniaria NRRL 30616]
MHLSKPVLAVLSALSWNVSARYISTGMLSIFDPPQPTWGPRAVQERGEHLNRMILPEGCEPATPCDQYAQPDPEGITPAGIPDGMKITCTPKVLKCTGPKWETPDNKAILFPWQPDMIANVIHKAGPWSASYLTQPEASDRPHPNAAREDLMTRRDETPETLAVDGSTYTRQTLVASKRGLDQETIVIFGDITTTLQPKPTAQMGKRDIDQETVLIFGDITTTLQPRPTPHMDKRDLDQETVVIFGTITTTMNPKPTPHIGKRDLDQETVVIFGTITTTMNPKPTPHMGKRDIDQETVVIFGDITTTLQPRPTPQLGSRDEDQETVVVFGDITTTLNPKPSPQQENFVIEATYVTNDKKALIIPTSGPQRIIVEMTTVTHNKKSPIIPTHGPQHLRAGDGDQALPDGVIQEEDFVIPTDMTLMSPNPNAGRVDPTALGQSAETATTMQRVVRRRQLVPNTTPGMDSSPDADSSPDTTDSPTIEADLSNQRFPPLRCHEWVDRDTAEATAVCAFGSSLNDRAKAKHLLPKGTEKGFAAVGRHAEYVCHPPQDSGVLAGTVECRGRWCGQGCDSVEKQKRGEGKGEYKFVFAAADAGDGFAGFWCPAGMGLEDGGCVRAGGK